MADFEEDSIFTEGVRAFEATDPARFDVLNNTIKPLVDRTRYLHGSVDELKQFESDLSDPDKGAAMVGYRGRTQADRNSDTPTPYDYDGATFQQRLEAAINAGGALTIPAGDYAVEAAAYSTSTELHVSASGARFTALNTGKLFDFGSRSVTWSGGVFEGGMLANDAASYMLYSDGADLIRVRGVDFLNVNFGVYADNAKFILFEDIYSEASRYWPIFAKSFSDSCHILNNRVFNGVYDGIKVAGNEASGPENTSNRLIISGNIGGGNRRDLIDFAVNNARLIVVENNISDNDLLRCVDAKIVYQSTLGMEDVIIANNICRRVGISETTDLTAYNIQGLSATSRVLRPRIFGNTAIAAGTNGLHSAFRLASCIDAEVFDNKSSGYYYFCRITAACANSHIHNNEWDSAVIGVQSQGLGADVPSKTVVRQNKGNCTGHASGLASAFVRIDGGDSTEIYQNEMEVKSDVYPVVAENAGTSATNTKIGRNVRGFSKNLPSGVRCVKGDTWLNPQADIGEPLKWVCGAQTASSSSANVFGVDPVHFRVSSGTPVGVLTPFFVGEEIYDTSGGRWWKSYGTSNSNWA